MTNAPDHPSAVPAGAAGPVPDPARRRWLRGLAAAPVLAGSATVPVPARATVRTSAHIVIAGSGLGGIAVANRLSRMLDGARITLVDSKEEHNYQPGYTLVATGVWPAAKVIDRNADLQPAGVQRSRKWSPSSTRPR